jgi:hypothetical protein
MSLMGFEARSSLTLGQTRLLRGVNHLTLRV